MTVAPKPSIDPRGAGADMRAAFVTLYDARDVDRMSGTGCNISQAFAREGLEMHYIGPLRRRIGPGNALRHAFNRYLLRKADHPQRDPAFLRFYARQVESQLRGADVDVVFASGGLPVSYLDTDLPLVVWTDCTFANLLDYYGKYCNLSARSIRDGHAADRNLYQSCRRAIFTSDWAAESAINDYGLPREYAAVIPFGANVAGAGSEADVEALVDARPRDRCILHFVGVDWVRKGGNIATEAARALNDRGIPTELRVMGVRPEFDGPLPNFITPLGYVSKSTPEGLERFTRLLGEAHFMIMPTRAEAYGFVYVEASAFGVPSLGTRTGGVPSAVNEGVNGLLFDLEDRGERYADEIERLFRDRDSYRHLAISSFRDHMDRTNWATAAREALGVLRDAAGLAPDRLPAVQRAAR